MRTIGMRLKGLAGRAGRDTFLASLLGLVLVGSVVLADENVQTQIGVLFRDPTWNRLLVIVLDGIAVSWIGVKVWQQARAARARPQYVLLWLTGLLLVVGLSGRLPTLPRLDLIQQLDWRGMDRPSQIIVQWTALWTLVVVLVSVFAGPQLRLASGIVTWGIAVLASVAAIGTLPESDRLLTNVPAVAGIWAAVVLVGALVGPGEQRRPRQRGLLTGIALRLRGLAIGLWSGAGVVARGVHVSRVWTLNNIWERRPRFRTRTLLGLILVIVLASSVITADDGVQHQVGELFGNKLWNRLLVIVIDVIAVGWISIKVWQPDRTDRERWYFAGFWAAGLLMIFGLVGQLPRPAQLDLVQKFDLRGLDQQAQALWQWSAFWTLLVVVLSVFTGPRMRMPAGVLTWLVALAASVVAVGTLPEDTLPPLVLLPVAAVWGALVFIGGVYGPRKRAGKKAKHHSSPAQSQAGVVEPVENRDASEDSRSGRPVAANVWATLALVLLALSLAEFFSYVTLDRQVNKGQASALQSVQDLQSRLEQVSKAIDATDTVAGTTGADITASFAALKFTAVGVSEAADAVVSASELMGIHGTQPTIAIAPTPPPTAQRIMPPQSARAEAPVAADRQAEAELSSDQQVASTGAAPVPVGAVVVATSTIAGQASAPAAQTSAAADPAAATVARLKMSSDRLQKILLTGFTKDPTTDRAGLSLFLTNIQGAELAAAQRDSVRTHDVLAQAELQSAGSFIWVAGLFAALVLLPWILFVLFLLQKREARSRQMLVDLCLLDGREPPDRNLDADFGPIRPGGVVDRMLGEGFRSAGSTTTTVGSVQNAIVQRAFSEQEYLVGLTLLSVVIAAGWYSVFYPRGGVGLADAIARGADARQMWLYLLTGLNPMTAGFAGAYFWCVYALVRRYLDLDLYPPAFLQCGVQVILALILALMFSVAVPPAVRVAGGAASLAGASLASMGSRANAYLPSAAQAQAADAAAGTQAAPTDKPPASNSSNTAPSAQSATTSITTSPTAAQAAPSPEATDSITILIAFFAGVSISAGFTGLQTLLRWIGGFLRIRMTNPLAEPSRLLELEGISVWTEARLLEEGIDNMQALANAPLHRLVLRTHFTTQRLVDWVDQAILFVHAAPWPPPKDDFGPMPSGQEQNDVEAAGFLARNLYRGLRRIGIRTATDLLAAGGWLTRAATIRLADVDDRQRALRAALNLSGASAQQPWLAGALFEVSQAAVSSPNWVFVANFRWSARCFLGDDVVKKWIVKENPPFPESPVRAPVAVAATAVASPAAPTSPEPGILRQRRQRPRKPDPPADLQPPAN